MKGSLFVIVLAIFATVILLLTYQRPARDSDAVPSLKGGVVTIQTANPYRFDVRLEVKCDWEWQKSRYRFHQWLIVPSKKQTLIKVPNTLTSCEIWPKVIF